MDLHWSFKPGVIEYVLVSKLLYRVLYIPVQFFREGLNWAVFISWAIFMVEAFNPCPAELLQLYFSSFEAAIANAISSFKWRNRNFQLQMTKNITIYEK